MKTAVVTGGAVRIGKEIVKGLAAAGWNVWAHYCNHQEEADELCRQLQGGCNEIRSIRADFHQDADIQKMYETIGAESGRIDLLVNSASLFLKGRIDDLSSVAIWDELFSMNLRAMWLNSLYALPLFRENGGCVINLADTATRNIPLEHGVYSLTKASVHGLTQTFSKATFTKKVRFNTLSPGYVLKDQTTSQTAWDKITRNIEVDETDRLNSIVNGVLFIAEHEYINGADIAIDGGLSIVAA